MDPPQVGGLHLKVGSNARITCRWWLTIREFDVATWHARIYT
tara:strand:- start:291 stop:416 length:126 start_codon:yes stop_codon:yes gene_type:complete